jgi:sortase A
MSNFSLIRARKAIDYRALLFCFDQRPVLFLVYVLGIAGMAAMTYCLAALYQSQQYQATALRAQVRSEETRIPAIGSEIGVLTIQRLQMNLAVVEGTDASQLKVAPGHIRETALPGEGGNVGIAGHRDSFFRPLRLIHVGDEIQIVTPRGEFHYRVDSTEIVDPNNIDVLRTSNSEKLTLVTCYPFYYVGAAPKRFIVHASCRNCISLAVRLPLEHLDGQRRH